MSVQPEFSPVEAVAYIGSRLPKLRKSGAELRGPCPIHHGKKSSFSINPETGLWSCHSGCQRGGDLIELEKALTGMSFPEARESVCRIVGRSSDANGELAMQYSYQDSTGAPIYRKVRRSGKSFRWEMLGSDGKWTPGLKGVTRVLYNLPDVISAETVVYCEGEKDAKRLREAGFVATTAGAASDWRPEFAQEFEGKTVIVLYDNDAPGKKHALQVCRALLPVAVEVKLVDLPGVSEKEDVSDWLDAGHRIEELRQLIDSSEALTAVSLLAKPDELLGSAPEAADGPRVVFDVSQLPSVWDIEANLEWAVDGLLVRGGVTLMTAESGTGKSWVGYAIAGAVAHGSPFADRETAKMPVLYLDGENPLYVVKERLLALGIQETDSVKIWGGWNDPPPTGPSEDPVIRFAKEKQGLIICDPLVAFHDGSEQDAGDTRRFMNKFRKLANLGATVLVMHHTGKGESSKQYRGSSDFKGSVDLAFKLRGDPKPDGSLDRLSLACFKGRVKPGQDLGMCFVEGQGLVASTVPEAHAAAARLERAIEAIAEFLESNPGAKKTEIEKHVNEGGIPREAVREALDAGEANGRWTKRKGRGSAIHYVICETEELDVQVNRRTAAA